MDPESLVARTRAVCEVARAIQRRFGQVFIYWTRLLSTGQTEIADLVNTLEEIETYYAATSNLAQAAYLSVRLECLNSLLVVLGELLADIGHSAQVKYDGFSLCLPSVLEKGKVQGMILRVRVEKKALKSALTTYV